MKKLSRIFLCVIMALLVCLPACSALAAPSASDLASERAELRTKTYKALLQLYEKQPKSREAIQHSYGYAVFVDTSYNLGLLGGGHGRGRAINQHSKREVFMKMSQMKVGLGVGVLQSNIIFVFDTPEAFDSFVKKGWTFGGQYLRPSDSGRCARRIPGRLSGSPRHVDVPGQHQGPGSRTGHQRHPVSRG